MIRRRPDGRSADYQRAYKRLDRIPTPDVLNWMDQAGSGVARALQDYRRDGDGTALEEVRLGLDALGAALDVVRSRH